MLPLSLTSHLMGTYPPVVSPLLATTFASLLRPSAQTQDELAILGLRRVSRWFLSIDLCHIMCRGIVTHLFRIYSQRMEPPNLSHKIFDSPLRLSWSRNNLAVFQRLLVAVFPGCGGT